MQQKPITKPKNMNERKKERERGKNDITRLLKNGLKKKKEKNFGKFDLELKENFSFKKC